jgi:hypothetical protein
MQPDDLPPPWLRFYQKQMRRYQSSGCPLKSPVEIPAEAIRSVSLVSYFAEDDPLSETWASSPSSQQPWTTPAPSTPKTARGAAKTRSGCGNALNHLLDGDNPRAFGWRRAERRPCLHQLAALLEQIAAPLPLRVVKH